MARATRPRRRKSNGRGVLLGFVLGVLAVALAGFAWVKWYRPKVKKVPRPALLEKRLAKAPSSPKLGYEEKQPPFGISEDGFEAGARVYRTHCARCHGTPGHVAATPNMPKGVTIAALPLWQKQNSNGPVGVSTQPPGRIYESIALGMQDKGMPAYAHVLSETQIWQVSLLLTNANMELPQPVQRLLSTAP